MVAHELRNESVEEHAPPSTKVSGRNLFIDLHGARLGDAKSAERALKVALGKLGKELRSVEVHRLADGTLSGVAVLGIGHLSFQANPRTGFAAVDVRGCAGLDPHAAMFALADAFTAREAVIQTARASDVVFLPAAKPAKARQPRTTSRVKAQARAA